MDKRAKFEKKFKLCVKLAKTSLYHNGWIHYNRLADEALFMIFWQEDNESV